MAIQEPVSTVAPPMKWNTSKGGMEYIHPAPGGVTEMNPQQQSVYGPDVLAPGISKTVWYQTTLDAAIVTKNNGGSGQGQGPVVGEGGGGGDDYAAKNNRIINHGIKGGLIAQVIKTVMAAAYSGTQDRLMAGDAGTGRDQTARQLAQFREQGNWGWAGSALHSIPIVSGLLKSSDEHAIAAARGDEQAGVGAFWQNQRIPQQYADNTRNAYNTTSRGIQNSYTPEVTKMYQEGLLGVMSRNSGYIQQHQELDNLDKNIATLNGKMQKSGGGTKDEQARLDVMLKEREMAETPENRRAMQAGADNLKKDYKQNAKDVEYQIGEYYRGGQSMSGHSEGSFRNALYAPGGTVGGAAGDVKAITAELVKAFGEILAHMKAPGQTSQGLRTGTASNGVPVGGP